MIITLTVFFLSFYSGLAWDYNDQDSWGGQCKGSRQSPIDINTNIESESAWGSPLKFVNYNTNFPGKLLPITNNGHTVKVSFTNIKENLLPMIKGGILGDNSYVLQEIHFHWGSNKSVGSEHTFNGKSHALEGHLVHRNKKYPSIAEAVKYSDGLTVLGILYEQKSSKSPLYPLTNRLSEVRKCEKESILTGKINLVKMFPAFDNATYYNYPGSLTTPDCNEVVNWIVYAYPSAVSGPDVSIFL